MTSCTNNELARYIDLPVFAGNRYVDLIASDGVLPLHYLSPGDETPFGVHYDGSCDRWSFGGSHHRMDGLNVSGVAARFALNDTIDFAGAIEHLSGAGFSGTSFFLGIDSPLTTQATCLGGFVYRETFEVFALGAGSTRRLPVRFRCNAKHAA